VHAACAPAQMHGGPAAGKRAVALSPEMAVTRRRAPGLVYAPVAVLIRPGRRVRIAGFRTGHALGA
jgi:hypothetical protein